jgi:hypothetical protein
MAPHQSPQPDDAAFGRQLLKWRIFAFVAAAVALGCFVSAGLLIVEDGFAAVTTFGWWTQALLGLSMSYTSYTSFRVARITQDARAAVSAASDEERSHG